MATTLLLSPPDLQRHLWYMFDATQTVRHTMNKSYSLGELHCTYFTPYNTDNKHVIHCIWILNHLYRRVNNDN